MNKADAKAAARWYRDAISFLLIAGQSDSRRLATVEGAGDLLNICTGLVSRGISLIPRDGRVVADPYGLAQIFRDDPPLLSQIISALHELFDVVADGQSYQLRVLPGTTLILDAAALKSGQPGINLVQSPEGREGVVQSVVWSAIGILSRSQEGDGVRRCALERCRRLFLAARPKQVFCSRKCASAAAFERYKTGKGEDAFRLEHRKTARESYRLRQRGRGRRFKPPVNEKKERDR